MKPNPLVITIMRIILGIILFVFGLHHFFGFLPLPTPPEAALEFMKTLKETGFMWYLIGAVEVLAGILLIIGRFLGLGLAIFAPVAVGILLHHLILDPAGGIAGYIVFILEVILVYVYFDIFKPLLQSLDKQPEEENQ